MGLSLRLQTRGKNDCARREHLPQFSLHSTHLQGILKNFSHSIVLIPIPSPLLNFHVISVPILYLQPYHFLLKYVRFLHSCLICTSLALAKSCGPLILLPQLSLQLSLPTHICTTSSLSSSNCQPHTLLTPTEGFLQFPYRSSNCALHLTCFLAYSVSI